MFSYMGNELIHLFMKSLRLSRDFRKLCSGWYRKVLIGKNVKFDFDFFVNMSFETVFLLERKIGFAYKN